MWFKQLSFYYLNEAVLPSPAQLTQALQGRPFSPCAGLDWSSEGWVAPSPNQEVLTVSAPHGQLFTLRRAEKVLPAAVIREALDNRIAHIQKEEHRHVGTKEKRALKEQITDDLLPRAFTRSGRLAAYIDRGRRYLIIGTASINKAEILISRLREALPPLPATPPRTRIAATTAMTEWVLTGKMPSNFALDAECELKDALKEGVVIRCSGMDLATEEIRQHLSNGKKVTRLGLVWRDRIRFVLTDTLQLKRLQFLDVLQEEASQTGEDAATLFTATFILMSSELGQLLDELIELLGGSETPSTMPTKSSLPG